LYSRGIRGFFTTSNSAASSGICASFAAIALLIDALRGIRGAKERRRRVLFAVVATAVVIAGLLLTQSKGGIMAFVVGLAVFGLLLTIDWKFAAHKRRILAILVPMAVLAVVVVAGIAIHYGLQHGRLPGGNSMLVRWQYWVASAQMCADHLFTGVGPGNFSDYYPHYKPAAALESVADPHNWPLSLLAQYGPLGLIAFIAMLCGPLWRWLRSAAPRAPMEAPSCQTVGTGAVLRLLAVLGLCLLLVRPLMIPTSGTGGFDTWLYEVFTLFVAPAAVFLIGFLLAASPFERAESTSATAAGSTLSASLVAAIVAVLLHNLIDFAIFEPGVWTAFWIILACLLGLHGHQEPRSHVLPRRPRRIRYLATVGAVVLFGLYVLVVWMPAYRTTMGIAQAQQAIASGRLDLAHEVLDETTRADRLASAAASLNGRLYLQQFEQISSRQPSLLEEAILCFRQATSTSPADYKNYEKMAIAYAWLGRTQDAYDWYLKAAGQYPGCDRLWFELGRLAETLGMTTTAVEHYRKAIEIEDSYREQFRTMYPDRKQVVSRLGEMEYRLARERIANLAARDGRPDPLTPKPPQ
nr:O-antigen ligase family protein [Phycisphaerae bacterium]